MRWILRTEHSRQLQDSFLLISIYSYLKYLVKMCKKMLSQGIEMLMFIQVYMYRHMQFKTKRYIDTRTDLFLHYTI